MIDLHRDGPVFVLAMNAGENRFEPGFLAAFESALDEVERAPAPAALVTSGAGKFYSNGLDVAWMMANGPTAAGEMIQRTLAVIGRVLTLPVFTVAAVNGHAFGAGAQLAVAHDLRLMRTGRGYWCMPEIDMPAPLHPGMVAILQARIPAAAVHEAIATGRRFGGEDAAAAGIVDRAIGEDVLLATAVDAAAAMAGKAHPVMARLKRSLYPRVLEAIATLPADLFG
jgi:Delta3-Delta2-enoyl-CoA isomerase